MFRKKFASLFLVAASAVTALALSATGVFASGSGPAPASAPANAPAYVDNRSDAVSLLVSYINALDRGEYDRAYSYWESGSAVGSYAAFKAGYATTQSIIISAGQVRGDAGAGQRYYIVPVTLNASTTGGSATYVGCYVEHLALPELQGAPFHGLSIKSATLLQVTGGANADTLRAQACTTAGYDGTPAVAINPTPGAPESGAQFYVDNRSGALEVIQSLVNALNRKEYARAYGYWEASASLPSFASFQQGYANTQAVQWTFGPVSGDAGAGQYYYSVPVTLKAQTTGGLQTFVGCYVLHLANPSIQDNPPYQPIGIRSGSFTQVDNSANTNTLMATACTNPPAQTPPPPPTTTATHISFAIGATSANVNGSVAAGGAQDYTLYMAASQWLFVDFGAGQPNVTVQVWSPSGQFIGQSPAGGTHWQGILPVTGQYRLRVLSSGAATGYNFTVTSPRRVSFARGAISASTPGTVTSGNMTSYVLRAANGQTLSATLNPSAGNIYLEVYDLARGQYVLNISARATTWSGRLPSTGDYLVRAVSVGGGAGGSGTFNLTTTIQ